MINKKTNHPHISQLLGFLIFFIGISSCSQPNEDIEPITTNRIIEFSGHEWVVRNFETSKRGPGPNYFSDSEENVWVDEQGRLHLKIVERNGIWYCSGVDLRRSHGFNKYVFYVSSNVYDLDDNIVAGLFTYLNDQEEIDIEFSRWADSENKNAQFAVQPSYKAGNKVRFDVKPREDLLTTHFFDWKPERISFGSFHGHNLAAQPEDVIYSWTYSGEDIPPDSNERLKINLWLFKGQSPTNNQEAELIIDRVEIY